MERSNHHSHQIVLPYRSFVTPSDENRISRDPASPGVCPRGDRIERRPSLDFEWQALWRRFSYFSTAESLANHTDSRLTNRGLEIYQNLSRNRHNKNSRQLDTLARGSRMTFRPSAVFDLGMGNFEPQNKKRVSIYLSGIVFFGSD